MKHSPMMNAPTATRPEKAFIGRAARDIVGIADFAGILGWGALVAVFALIANAIMLAMRDRIRDHAIMQTLGWTGPLIGWMVLVEGAPAGALRGRAWCLRSLADHPVRAIRHDHGRRKHRNLHQRVDGHHRYWPCARPGNPCWRGPRTPFVQTQHRVQLRSCVTCHAHPSL